MAGGWLSRWHGLLPTAEEDRQRVRAGRAFQRSGRVASLRVDAGRLSGRVQGSRPTPYHVEALLGVLGDEAWRSAVDAIAGQVRFAARLLAGDLPDGLVEALEGAGVDLFAVPQGIDTRCACGEATPVCAHLVALWEEAAVRFSRDPFMLLRLRGRGRQQLLAELASLRRHDDGDAGTVEVAGLPVQGWSTATQALQHVRVPHSRGQADPLRMLGDPPGWAGVSSAAEMFRPLVDRAVARARELRG